MTWKQVLQKPLGKQLQSDILKYIEYNPNTTVNKIIKGLNKNILEEFLMTVTQD